MSEWLLFLTKLGEQFYLVGMALILALLIGLPLGIYIRQFKKFKIIFLALVSALWTIPSLALLAFFIPFFGIGTKPAILVLVIYAVLPILRNTIVGLENVSSASIHAAEGLGFTRLQKFWMVELPLAMPVIIAGIRMAVSICVGVATLAAFIGAGGLGDYISQGLALNNTSLILWGAVPAAMMALILDYAMGSIENLNITQIIFHKFFISSILFLIVSIISISIYFYPKNIRIVRVASKNFTEQIILGELMAQLIEAKTNIKVIRKFNLGTTAICHRALINNEIDIYPEYSGTAYLTVLKLHGLRENNQIYSLIKSEYQSKYHLIWLAPFGFNNTQVLAMREDFAKNYHIHAISDLKFLEDKLIMGVPPEFMQREDALIGLMNFYHLNFRKILQMDPSLMYKAILAKEVNLINAFSTDARISAYHLVALLDDEHFYPAYYAAPVVRADILKKYPEIEKTLTLLSGKIDNEMMQKLNYKIDVEHQNLRDVVHAFLKMNNWMSK